MFKRILIRLTVAFLIWASVSLASSAFSKAVDPVVQTELALNTVNSGYAEFAMSTLYNDFALSNYMVFFAAALLTWALYPFFFKKQ